MWIYSHITYFKTSHLCFDKIIQSLTHITAGLSHQWSPTTASPETHQQRCSKIVSQLSACLPAYSWVYQSTKSLLSTAEPASKHALLIYIENMKRWGSVLLMASKLPVLGAKFRFGQLLAIVNKSSWFSSNPNPNPLFYFNLAICTII